MTVFYRAGVCTGILALLSCGKNSIEETTSSVPLGLVYSAWSIGENPNIQAIQVALQDVNEAQVLSQPLTLSPAYFNATNIGSPDLSEDLIQNHGAKILLTEWSQTAYSILRQTNTEYPDVVQCNANGSGSGLNNPLVPNDEDGIPNSDKNDTLYRAVGDSRYQAHVMWSLVPDSSKAAIYVRDDAWGRPLALELDSLATPSGGWVEKEQYAVPFASDSITEFVKNVLIANQEERLNSVILVAFSDGLPELIKALVEAEPPFKGTLISGLIGENVFNNQVNGLSQWLQTEGNVLYGTVEENYSGEYTQTWLSRLPNEVTQDISQYLTNHADCMYATALAMIYGDVLDGDMFLNFKEHMNKLKIDALQGDNVVEIARPDAQGFRAARTAIENNKLVRMEGAAGPLVFDEHGDRLIQLYKIAEASFRDGQYLWETINIIDPRQSENP